MNYCKENKKQFTMEQIKTAKRLAYLLDLRDQDPRRYRELGLGTEKETIYVMHPEVVPLATQIYNGVIKV
jgi:hypothetical protein